jgi:hypothetical protein
MVPDPAGATSGIRIYSWSDTTISCGVPLSNAAGTNFIVAGNLPVVVTANSLASNSDKTIVVKPKVYGVNPTHGNIGDTVAIIGTAFSGTAGSNSVSFNGTSSNAATVQRTTGTETIEVNVPTGAVSGQLLVTVNGQVSNANFDYAPFSQVAFTVDNSNAPAIAGISPIAAEQGQTLGVIISATNGNWTGDMKASVHFSNSGITVNSATATDANHIAANITIGSAAATGAGTVSVTGASGTTAFTVTLPGTGPLVTSITPSSAPAGTRVVIRGLRFGSSQDRSQVLFKNLANNTSTQAMVLSWADTMIEAIIPSISTGSYEVTVSEISSVAGTLYEMNSNPAAFIITGPVVHGVATIWPNPFNAGRESVNIAVTDTGGATNLGFYIYDMTAQLVNHQTASAPSNSVTWNGYNLNSNLVGDGAYVVRVINEDNKSLIAKGKLLVVKR